MKYCQNCGKQLDDNASFCIECGGNAMEQGGYSAPADYSDVRLLSPNTVLNTVRECAKSKLFLVAIILYTITIVMSFVTSIYNINNTYEMMDMYTDIMGGNSFSSEIMSSPSYGVGNIIGVIIGMVPAVLIAIGMWITYASAAGENDRMTTAGLTIIKVVAIIYLVLMCIAAVLMVLVLALMLIFFEAMDFDELFGIWNDYGMSSGEAAMAQSIFIVVFAILFIMIIAVLAFSIFYYAKIIKTVNVIKSTVQTGTVTGKISVFVAVMAIIIGGCIGLSGLSSLLLGQFLLAITSILSALVQIFLGVVLFSYRNKIRVFEN